MDEIYGYSGPELVRRLGARFRDYRMRAKMTQQEVATSAAISVVTVHKFESGAARNISLDTLIRLLRSIHCLEFFDELLPELPPSPYLINRQQKPMQRIRKK
ncbi:MAG: helix-turn-helix domain-containing protein [Bacteroidales bacterium]|nr:helix-turn-helix domain-containing protein [Bacteroidales bacterium]MCD8386356.1 helix-turn-helix domain-containing protein [Bacteroidales bacterium]